MAIKCNQLKPAQLEFTIREGSKFVGILGHCNLKNCLVTEGACKKCQSGEKPAKKVDKNPLSRWMK